MKRKRIFKRNKGITLIELALAMALLGIVMLMSTSLIILPTRVHDQAMDESEIQFKLRMVCQNVDKIIRDASATFALYRVNHTLLTSGWNYIIPSMDVSTTQSTSIIEYKWDSATLTHIPRVIAEPLDGVTYNLVFTKLKPSQEDNLLQYKIIATINGQSRNAQSEVEALNSLQVIDRGSTTFPSNTLAYRTDARPTQVSDVQAAVSMVLDISGSMLNDMNGNYTSNPANSRNGKLKVEAKRLINALSANPNIFISIVPFNNDANGAQPMLPARVNETANAVLLNKIDNMNAQSNRGTNTGDGLRRAYYILDDFNDDSLKITNNFMIVLVDGVTTFYSAYKANAYYQNGRYWTTSAVFFDGDNQINGEIDYGPSSNTTIGYYGGNGYYYDDYGKSYVNTMGLKIKNYGSGTTADKEPIKVYIIGFSAVQSEFASLRDIAVATTGSTVYYEAGDSAALEDIFTSIQKDINDSLWHIGGPN